MRIGNGYDVHRLLSGRRLILGGVEIPHPTGLSGHSDADVLVHAIIDACLGAAGLGDIGVHFPDDSLAYEGISSLTLLERVRDKLSLNGFEIVNIDCVIVAERPKLSPFIPEMRENISLCLKTEESRVNIKATTEEGLGFTGAEEGISAWAVCLLDTAPYWKAASE
ncbi:MAG: 2-C-methyl-D-erythritol 2,4-cyclodiphosphate synthase [Clostridiales bacterium]|jgi:2-C-methyl-D-erythritol 2,4-cyclodiphosphate synthase|nr:2-C-methyl-D-erythritol 2,4-cyclodiphosphate synthase [Clostridiales bacterium]